ncbi:hypothetical protein D8674_006298 [Pyrus ussuriensis x Pyrus communis]|uniref:RNase H type-1 domain-containing protein n=1 Tax=Pyrus ussuriensis x Pyrus communis TaxID=2448454 RepID=A0A5N5FYF2_9ROSA|nr:hypothetical protein D8674_006298 [Pyrus ussuriensis x Pyrus communis]
MMVARDAPMFVKEWQFPALVLEGDAFDDTSHFGNILNDTRSIVHSLPNWKVEFSGTETNKVAHKLARMSLSYGNTVTWFEEPPDVILDLLFEDSNS